MSEKGKLSVGCIVVLAIAVIVAIIFIFASVKNCQQSISLEPFEPYLGDYVSIPGLQPPDPAGEPYIAGKVIMMDIAKEEFDDINSDLSKELRAKTPEEVGTIVWLEWGRKLIGYYTISHAAGYKITCDVTIIDKEKAAIVGRSTFYGSDPPESKAVGGEAVGSKPTDEVIDYLEALPRQ